MKLLKSIISICSLSIMLFLTACGGGGSSSSDGSLSLKLTDATTNDYQAVYVTIEEVRVCLDDENEGEENSWLTVAEPEKTYNLLELVNGVQEQLGITDLDAGHYTQMRLIIGTTADDGLNILGVNHPPSYDGNYIVDDADAYHKLKIPSGIQTGIKLVSGFDIYENQTTELILDFDASRSVVKAGNSGKWLLKPTIKVLGTTVATISGNVGEEGNGGLEGVLVSAQVYNSDDDDVIVQASTITDEDGDYVLFVEPGVYNLVAYVEGYDPKCNYIDKNLTLASALMGTLGGHVNVDTELEDPYVSISVRQSTQCETGIDTKIEIVFFNIIDVEDYSVNLPVGTYEIVAETEGYDPQVHTVDITEDSTTELDINFESGS
ncbi:MAG: DUF4382 domain-containing protein [Deltaproteobacteria bacterium]|nr:DUF4382 domain-containing protein [Deltaproteobacteria bacterium]